MAIRFIVIIHNVLAVVLAGMTASANAQNKHMGMAQPPKMLASIDNEWGSVFRRARDRRLKGNYTDALSAIKQALVIARAQDDPRKILTSLNMLGLLYWFEGRLADAEPILKEAIALIESKFGSKDSLLMNQLGNLAEVYQDQYRFEEAESLFRRKTLAQDDPTTLLSVDQSLKAVSARGQV